MLVTTRERHFLAAFIREATTDPFKGPATEELHRRNIYYNDLSHLLTAYYREGREELEQSGGGEDPTPPPCPWEDWEGAVRRDQEVALALGLVVEQGVK